MYLHYIMDLFFIQVIVAGILETVKILTKRYVIPEKVHSPAR